MPIVLDGTAGITTPEIVSTGGPLVVNASAPDNSVVVNASGNVGIGTSSVFDGNTRLELSKGGNCQQFISCTDGARLYFSASGNTVGAMGTFSNHPLVFRTNDIERARIDSSGSLLIGTTSPSGGGKIKTVQTENGNYAANFQHSNTSPFGVQVFYSNVTPPNNTSNRFIDCEDTVGLKAQIRSNGGIANFSGNNVNLSDRREKTNFAPAKSYLETICAIPVQTFNYIDQNHEEDPGLTLGVVAQDVQEVAPELVMESNWGSKEEPKMRLSVYQTDLQYALMKAIQELKAINDAQAQTIESLTARVVALEQA